MVDSMKQIFLLKPEVLTPNRNGFMAKKRKWHLKAGSTVHCNRMVLWLKHVSGISKLPKSDDASYIHHIYIQIVVCH